MPHLRKFFQTIINLRRIDAIISFPFVYFSPVSRGNSGTRSVYIPVRCSVSLWFGPGVSRPHSNLHILACARPHRKGDNDSKEHVARTFRGPWSHSWNLYESPWHHQDLLLNCAPWKWYSNRSVRSTLGKKNEKTR